jgi:hypothetical protein
MRFFVVKQDTDLKALGQTLFKANRNVMTDRLKTANPHVDFSRVEAGSVLLIPDSGDPHEADAQTIGQAGLERLEREFVAAFRATSERIRNDTSRRNEADKEADKLLRSASIRKIGESEPNLRERLIEASEHLRARARDSKDVAARLDSIEGGLMEELGKLQRLFR